MADILILHGPNLNMLGKREPQIYGSATLDEINEKLSAVAADNQVTLDIFQSNSEGALVDKIQQASNDNIKYIVVNAAALTHCSISLRDAFKLAGIPFIEVHLSNVFTREEFRHKSFLADIAIGVISGFGPNSYVFALQHMISLISKK